MGEDATLLTLNRVTQLVFARHMLEFVASAQSSPLRSSSSGSFCFPRGLLAYLKAPSWGEPTYANTLGAILACVVVYDLFFFSLQCFVVGQKGRGPGVRGQPLQFAVATYFHLAAVAVVAMSPIGCHVTAVVGFLALTGVIDAMHQRGTSLEDLLVFHHAGSAGYAKIGWFWDWACNTAA